MTTQALTRLSVDLVAKAPPKELLDLAVRGGIKDVQVARELFHRAREVAIVCAPTLDFSVLPPKMQIRVNLTVIDTASAKDKQGNLIFPAREIYRDSAFCKGDEVALTKSGLLRLVSAAGCTVRSLTVEALGEYHWLGRATLVRRGLNDGLAELQSASREVDYRDGAPDLYKPEYRNGSRTGNLVPLDATAIAQARRHGRSHAETKALNRAFRGFPGLGIRQAYPLAELQAKPFMFAVLVPDLDMEDPADRRLASMVALGAMDQLYGPSPDAPLPMLGPGEAVSRSTEPVMTARLPPVSAGGVITADAAGAEEEEDGDEEPDPAGDDESLDGLEPPPETKRIVCACPCGHQVEIDQGTKERTLNWLGIEVCVQCIPSARFNDEAHVHLKRLKFPKRPDLESPAEAIEAAHRARKAKR